MNNFGFHNDKVREYDPEGHIKYFITRHDHQFNMEEYIIQNRENIREIMKRLKKWGILLNLEN